MHIDHSPEARCILGRGMHSLYWHGQWGEEVEGWREVRIRGAGQSGLRSRLGCRGRVDDVDKVGGGGGVCVYVWVGWGFRGIRLHDSSLTK